MALSSLFTRRSVAPAPATWTRTARPSSRAVARVIDRSRAALDGSDKPLVIASGTLAGVSRHRHDRPVRRLRADRADLAAPATDDRQFLASRRARISPQRAGSKSSPDGHPS